MNREFRSYLPSIAKFALFVLALCAVIIIAALTIEWARNTEEEGVEVQQEEIASIEGDNNEGDQSADESQTDEQGANGNQGQENPESLPELETESEEPIPTPTPAPQTAPVTNDPDGDGLPNTGIEEVLTPLSVMAFVAAMHFYLDSRKELTGSLLGKKPE